MAGRDATGSGRAAETVLSKCAVSGTDTASSPPMALMPAGAGDSLGAIAVHLAPESGQGTMGHNEAMDLVEGAESAGSLSPAAAANIRRWLTEAPFARYRDRLVEEIRPGVGRIWRTPSTGSGVRDRRASRADVPRRDQRPERADDGREHRGLADYVTAQKGAEGAADRASIAYRYAAQLPGVRPALRRVLAAAGFKVYLFPEPRSTPLLSTAVRYLGCDAGIMITASHNPPSDNGFKCYNSHGGQVIPPDDAGIIECVKAASDREIPEEDFEAGRADGSDRRARQRGRRALPQLGRRRGGHPGPRAVDRLHAAARGRGDLVGRRGPAAGRVRAR